MNVYEGDLEVLASQGLISHPHNFDILPLGFRYYAYLKQQSTKQKNSPEEIEKLASLKRQSKTLHRTLNTLEEQKAKYSINVPVEIVHGIDDTKKELERINAAIAELEK